VIALLTEAQGNEPTPEASAGNDVGALRMVMNALGLSRQYHESVAILGQATLQIIKAHCPATTSERFAEAMARSVRDLEIALTT
jgi:hypothetical protein